MKRMQSLMAVVLGAGAVTMGAGAQFNSEFTAWGNNSYGQGTVPSDVLFTSIVGGNLHSLGLTWDGRVRAWGSNASAQCTVPTDLRDVVQVAAGGWYQTTDQRGHSAALLSNGTVRAWGSNQYGECDVPLGLAGVTQIACGWAHTVAVTSNGHVVVWGAGATNEGDPNWGQQAVPTNIGAVSRIATKGCHITAQLADGSVRCWGRNAEEQCDIPPKLGVVLQIAAGSDHSVVLLPSGEVRCWGWNYHSQSTVPTKLGVAREVAASMYGTMALLQDGRVATWGLIDAPPETIGSVEHITGGGYHAIALSPRDCNANGVSDSIEIATTRAFDSDGDGLLNACDGGTAAPIVFDIVITRATAGPFPWPICEAWDTRTEAVAHLWDMWVSRESQDGPWMNRAGVPTGNSFNLDAELATGVNTIYCRMDPNRCSDPFFTANLWLEHGSGPSLSATNAQPTAAFSGQIPNLVAGPAIPASGTLAKRIGTWQVRITDFSVTSSSDLVGPVAFQQSGSSDLLATITLEVLPFCAADITHNGLVDGVDLAIILATWGTNGDQGGFNSDVNGDGIINGTDLATILGAWGICQ